jgi:dTDP-4-amino-4,6-dideoxygalactose transaminase
VEKRRALSASYEAALGGIPVVLPWQHSDMQSSWHLYVVQLQLDRINRSRAEVFQYLRNYGIGVNVHYIPVNMQPFYQMDGSAKCATPEAFNYYQRAISLPMYTGLSGEQMEQVVRILKKACFDV